MTKHAIDNIINAIADLILEEHAKGYDGRIPILPGGRIVFGPELANGSVAMTPGPGAPTDVHLDKGMVYRLPITINAKDGSMETLLSSLYFIHEYLTQKLNYNDLVIPDTDEAASGDYQVVDIETTAAPTIVGREQSSANNSGWLAGSSIEVKFYWFIKNN